MQATQVTTDAAQQRGLADAVGANDGDALAGFHREIEIFKQRVVVSFGNALRFDRQPVKFFLAIKAHERILTRRWFEIFNLDFIDLLRTRSGLTCLRFIRGKSPHKFLQLSDFLFGFSIDGQLLRPRLSRGQHVFVVVARIDLQGAVIHVGHMSADLIQEVTIMGNDDHGRIALVQHVFQPANGIDVEVVGRLVKQQNIWIRK